MPIYAYKCASCGYAKDALQKISDAPLTICPQCGQPTFQKQVTAASFQLKGAGWYVTDFRDGGAGASVGAPAADEAGKAGAKPGDAPSGGDPGKSGEEGKAGPSSEAKAESKAQTHGGRGGDAVSAPASAPSALSTPSSSVSSSSGGAAAGG
ncbi:MAG: hypothetical protein LBH31_01230 [Burkholderiaceae bacterium]|jgi:putative FmdB family regulatory protein|nr:hypothetical protein [Burkholderiaceae bacterium]